MDAIQVTITVKRSASLAERQLLGRAIQWLMRLPPRGTRLSNDNPQAVERLLAGMGVPFIFLSADIGSMAEPGGLSAALAPLGPLVDNIRLNGRSWHPKAG